MKRLLKLFTSLLGLFFTLILSAQNEGQDYQIKLDDNFISQLKSFDYKTNPQKIITECFKCLSLKSKPDEESKPFLVQIEANIDDDPSCEIISLMGWNEIYPNLVVLKNIDNTWYIVYFEPLYMFYSPPELRIINSPSKNKTFYIRQLTYRGSGIYSDSYYFYKLINKKVYKCLNLIHEARIYGWGLALNQEVSMELEPSSGLYDRIFITYDYNFFPGAVLKNDVPWADHSELSFVKNKQGVYYSWVDSSKSYKLVLS